jgi:hypothetical protein
MSDAGTLFGNAMIVIGCLFGMLYYLLWIRTGRLSVQHRAVGHAWLLKDLAIMTRIGWWVLALIMAKQNCAIPSETCSYHPFFVEYKHWMTIPTGIAYVYGQLMFIRQIERFSLFEKAFLFLSAVFIALAVTLLGY